MLIRFLIIKNKVLKKALTKLAKTIKLQITYCLESQVSLLIGALTRKATDREKPYDRCVLESYDKMLKLVFYTESHCVLSVDVLEVEENDTCSAIDLEIPCFQQKEALISVVICCSISGLRCATGLNLHTAASAFLTAVILKVCGYLILEGNRKIFP